MPPVQGTARRPAVAGVTREMAGGNVRSHGDQVTKGFMGPGDFTPSGHPKGPQTPTEQSRTPRL